VQIARLEITGPEPADQAVAERLLDILWAHLEPGHNIEHITVTATPPGIDIAVFIRHRLPNPNQYAADLLGGIIGQLPALRNWKCRQLN
jgi:hypothetical protein